MFLSQSLTFGGMFCGPLFVVFVPFFLAIMLSVLLRFTASYYQFGIVKRFRQSYLGVGRSRTDLSSCFFCPFNSVGGVIVGVLSSCAVGQTSVGRWY
jgi:hypothetical protein